MTEFVNPLDNPELANAQIAAILSDDGRPPVDDNPKPTLEPPSDTVCRLPGMGYEVVVRELNGEDEEMLARVQSSFGRWIATLLELAIERIDGKDATKESVAELLVGDRDYLLLAIRRATWGPEIELPDAYCSHCEQSFETSVHVDDVPVKRLADPSEATFTLPLRRGRKAVVRLPNGTDQAVYLEGEMTNAQRNTILLQRCVTTIYDAQGNDMPVVGFPSMVREGIALPDRAKLLREINDRMPGAQYNEVTVTHKDCGESSKITLGPVALFPDLYLS